MYEWVGKNEGININVEINSKANSFLKEEIIRNKDSFVQIN